MYERTSNVANPSGFDSLAVTVPGIVDRTYFPFNDRPSGERFIVRFPLTPIWPGFLYNTLFYAALSWLVARLALAAKRGIVGHRRTRRGLCPRCAYPRPEHAPDTNPVPCPECGHTPKPKRPRATPAAT